MKKTWVKIVAILSLLGILASAWYVTFSVIFESWRNNVSYDLGSLETETLSWDLEMLSWSIEEE